MTDDIVLRTHDEFLKNRSIILKGTIDDKTVEGVMMQIIKWNEEDLDIEFDSKHYDRTKNPIKIYISSGGGLVTKSLGIMGMMECSLTPIHTYCLDMAASAAFMIFICGHKRFIHPYSVLMYHDMSGGRIGKTEEIQEDLVEQLNLVSIYHDIVKRKTKITQKMLDKIHKERRDMYYYSSDILKYKMADEIILFKE